MRLLALFLAVSLLGCGPTGPKLVTVRGKATWNGKPIDAGMIVFEPVDQSPAGSGKITGGTYQADTSAGKNLVRVFAERDSGKIDPAMGAAPRVQYLPPEFNHQSKIEREIGASGESALDFELNGAEITP